MIFFNPGNTISSLRKFSDIIPSISLLHLFLYFLLLRLLLNIDLSSISSFFLFFVFHVLLLIRSLCHILGHLLSSVFQFHNSFFFFCVQYAIWSIVWSLKYTCKFTDSFSFKRWESNSSPLKLGLVLMTLI